MAKKLFILVLFTLSVIAIQAQTLSLTTFISPACNGTANGFASVNVTGGAPPYTYLWSTGATTFNLTWVPSGTYNVTVTDNIGAQATTSVTIGNYSFTANITGDTILCAGETLYLGGMASSGGGNMPNTYNWSGPGIASTFSSLVIYNATPGLSGTYYFAVTNTYGCIALDTVSVTINPDNSWTGTADSLWSNTANWSCGSLPNASSNVTIPANAPNMPLIDIVNAIANQVMISPGATLTFTGLGHALEVKGDVINNGHFSAMNGKVILSGSGSQYVPGTIYDSLAITGGGDASFSGSAIIRKQLQLSSGHLVAGPSDIHLSIGAAISGSAAGYIVTNSTGTVTIDSLDVTTSPILIPLGTVSSYTPLQLSNLGNVDDFSVKVGDSVYASYNEDFPEGTALTANAVAKTWYVSEAVSGGSNAIITTYWNAIDELPGFNRAQSYVSHYSNTTNSWMPGLVGAANGQGPYWHTINNITSFSPFGVGSAGSPLPLKMVDITGSCNYGVVNIAWSVQEEKEMSAYSLERSFNGSEFQTLYSTNATGKESYTYRDNGVAGLDVERMYYRLLLKEVTGEYSYSDIVAVNVGPQSATPVVYPNPAGDELHVSIVEPIDRLSVKLLDAESRVIKSEIYTGKLRSLNLDIHQLPAGMYLLELGRDNKQPEIIRFLKR